VEKGMLGEREWKVYQFIARSFFGCISYDAKYETSKVIIQVDSEQFKLKGQRMIDPGFVSFMPWL
jgi:DNA topoisomerase-1